MKLCHCGKPLHYSDRGLETMVNKFCAAMGDYVPVIQRSTGKKFKVQRHYISLHGIKEQELHTYGFEEIKQ